MNIAYTQNGDYLIPNIVIRKTKPLGHYGRLRKAYVMMKELGLYDLTPALCHLDYTMSEAGGVTNFVRQYTLASGGPYCDCGYKKKTNK